MSYRRKSMIKEFRLVFLALLQVMFEQMSLWLLFSLRINWFLAIIRVMGLLESFPALTRGKAGIHPDQVTSLSWDTHAIHSHTHTRNTSGCPNNLMRLLMDCGRRPKGLVCASQNQTSQYEVTVLTAAPCHPSFAPSFKPNSVCL